MFSDVAKIYVKAGDGGNGRLSFLHEKYREFGGPDGGDGGDGGDVVFQADDSWNTLYFYKTHRKLLAENGEVGKARKRHGKNGQDLIIKVPIGTAIYHDENDRLLADLDKVGSEAVIAKGGEGGFGNAHFTSSTRQTPAFAELGTKGESFEVRLEMKLIADVGLVGLPNIGKSTLLSVVTSAKPKIADYPFTTIIPNLGVVEGFESKGFVIADIPGLIAGASSGKGLGDEFLRHVERTRVLIHLIDALSDNPSADFETISQELEAYDLGILEKPQILAFSRIDLLTDKEKNELAKTGELIIKKHKNIFKYDKKPYLFSSVTHLGLEELIREVDAELSKIPKETKMEVKTFTIADVAAAPNVVEKIDNKFVVTGPKLEKFAQKTDFSNEYAVLRLYDIMKKTGIIKQIEKKGGRFGDKIEIIGREIDYRG